jgi:hypothetical protein
MPRDCAALHHTESHRNGDVRRTWSASLAPALALLALGLGNCAPAAHPRLAAFHEQEYAPYASTGDASISGQVSLMTKDGYVTSGGGCKEVLLDPVTSYSSEWVEREVTKNEQLVAPDPRSLLYRRRAQADGTGHFSFEQLPPGSYYLACLTTWDRWVMLGTQPTMFEEVTWVHGRITLAPGEHGRIVLTH